MTRSKSPQNLTQDRLKELLHYDPETGIFTRLIRRGGCEAGTTVGSVGGDGYLCARVLRRDYLLHRLAFLYMTGVWPERDVDHINGVRTDNRWGNLRAANGSENRHNLGGPYKNGRSGFLGVSWNKAAGGWAASIQANKVRRYLGLFATPEAAHTAYLKAKDELHPTHRRLRSAA